MHIGIDARIYGTRHRGIGRYVEQLIIALLKRDDNNRYTIFTLPETMEKIPNAGGKCTVLSVDCAWYGIAEQIKLPGIIKKSKVQYMYFPHFNVPYACPVPYVVTIHDLIAYHFPDERATTLAPWKYNLKVKAMRVLMRRALRRSLHNTAVSHYTKRDIMKHFSVPEQRISVVYPGVETFLLGTERYANTPQFQTHLTDTYGVRPPYILYVGSAYPHKNLETLIDAYTLVRAEYGRNWQLVLAGRHDAFYERIRSYVAHTIPDPDIQKDIVFTNEVRDNDLDGLYRGAKLFVFPSRYEGFGLPLLEAAARGIPVVAAKNTSIPEVMSDAAYYVDAENAAFIAHGLDIVGGSAALQQELSEKGIVRSKQFSWNQTAQEISRIFETYMQ